MHLSFHIVYDSMLTINSIRNKTRSHYRPDVDGLHVFYVMPVILYYINVIGLSGCFVGGTFFVHQAI